MRSTLNTLESQRLISKNETIDQVIRESSQKIKDIADDEELPEMFKEKLIEELLDNMNNTLTRIKNDAIAEQHNLK